MNDTDYKRVLQAAFERAGDIIQQMDQLEMEATKLRQFITATINMLPDGERGAFVDMLEMFRQSSKASDASLKQACVRVLREFYPRWVTVAQIRDRLTSSGFDFSKYTSNSLASVSTTLRRMDREKVQTADVEGVAAYRLRHRWRRKGKLKVGGDLYASGMRGNEKPPKE